MTSTITLADFLARGETRTRGTYTLVKEARRRRGRKDDTYMVVLDTTTQSYVDGRPYGEEHTARRALVGGLSVADARGLAASILATVPADPA